MEKDNKNPTILSIKNLNVYFKTHGKDSHVIRGINLDIKRGECFAIVGESGSGKSVFTKTFTGMLDTNGKVKEGSIILNDVEINDPKIIRRKFADIHRHDVKMEKLHNKSADVALKLALDKEEKKYQKAHGKYQRKSDLATDSGYKRHSIEIIDNKYHKNLDYYNLYFADHLTRKYNKSSNCMIKQQSISNRVTRKVSKLLEVSFYNDYDAVYSKIKKQFELNLNSNEDHNKLSYYVEELEKEVVTFADFTPGQEVTYKALYKGKKKLVSLKKKLLYAAIKSVVEHQTSKVVNTTKDVDEHLNFVQDVIDLGMEFALDALEVKRKIISIAIKKTRCARDNKMAELKETREKNIETINAGNYEKPELVEKNAKQMEALTKAHEVKKEEINKKYTALYEKYTASNKPILSDPVISEEDAKKYIAYPPSWVAKYVKNTKALVNYREKEAKLSEDIHKDIAQAIEQLDKGDTKACFSLAEKFGFASKYFKKRIDSAKKDAESHVSQIDENLKKVENDERRHLLEVEREAALSTEQMQLTQINSDIKNALSIYSVQDNREMVKIKDSEHYIINEVPTWRRVLRKIRRLFTIKKPMVKALRDKGIIRDRSVNLAKFKTNRQWSMIRGSHIATIFQDPMTSLNPLLKIGSQITDVLRLHHNLTKAEAKKEAISLLERVHIPNPEERFNDYPYQYSGGMRQRVVIAIALACRPDILICDEPTTALDVTVQAQILALIKELQQEYKFTTIFITHDLGVVAGVADRVGVMYGGQLVEIGTDEDVFYRPAHPYTWALLSSLPQLAVENEPLTFIRGNPPVFTKEIEGDSFAPRSDYAMRIDYMIEPPMFKISETHYAKTWLLDPRAPKVKKPLLIRNLSKRMEETAKSFLSTDNSLNGGE